MITNFDSTIATTNTQAQPALLEEDGVFTVTDGQGNVRFTGNEISLFDRNGTIIQSGAFALHGDIVCRVSEIHARISVVDVTDLASKNVIRVFHPRTELTILGYTIQPASCNGYHVKYNGRVERREDRKPHVFTTREQCEDYIRQSYSSMHTQEVEVVQ